MNFQCNIIKKWKLHDKMLESFITDDTVINRCCQCKSCGSFSIRKSTKDFAENFPSYLCIYCSRKNLEEVIRKNQKEAQCHWFCTIL
jgi:hypothetical protein